MSIDFRIRDAGSLVGLEPVSQEAKQWCEEYLEVGPQWGRTRYIEAHCFGNILHGISEAGLTWEG